MKSIVSFTTHGPGIKSHIPSVIVIAFESLLQPNELVTITENVVGEETV